MTEGRMRRRPKPTRPWTEAVWMSWKPRRGGTNPPSLVSSKGLAPKFVAPERAPAMTIKTATAGKIRTLAKRFLSQLEKALEPGRALKRRRIGEKITIITILIKAM